MIIEFLGTGTSQGVPVVGCSCSVCRSHDPRDARLRTSVLVRVGEVSLLIDAGPDLRQQALRADIQRLDAVLLTHEHMDHIAGIDELRAFNFKQRRPMTIYANQATLEAVRRVYHYAFSEARYPGVPELELIRIGKEPFRVSGIEVRPIEVMHLTMPVLGFRIGGFAYITDAKTMDDDQFDRLTGVEVLVLNALRQKSHISHLNLEEALAWIARIRPKRAFLTHISHLMGSTAELERSLPPNVTFAFDGLVLELPDPARSQ
ncbi:MAG: MBL fold metallo-hydrolase [Flavobacteriales bacterium]|nr:MBL fold metallo-hydrolase [Flavobacteriales bacterium]